MNDLVQGYEEQTELKSLTDKLPLSVGDVLFSSGDLHTYNRVVLD